MLNFRSWPISESDRVRVREILRHQALFRGDFLTAFADKREFCPPGETRTLVTGDWPALISKVSSDMLFGEEPIVTAGPDQEQLAALIAQTGLWTTCLEASLCQSYRGAAVLHLFWDLSERRISIEQIPAYNYYVETHPDNARRVLSEAVAWFVDAGSTRYLRVDHHYPGRVVREAFEFGSTSEHLQSVGRRTLTPAPLAACYPGLPVPAPEEMTGLGRSSLFYVPNVRGDGYYGSSDYTLPLESLFDSFNERLTDNQDILHDHADPKLLLPQGVLDEDGEVAADDLRVIEIPPGSENADGFRYLTWDGQLQGAFQQVDLLSALIFKFSEVSPAIFGEDKAGSIESGRAMKFRFQRTLSKMARKARYWQSALTELLWWMQKLAADRGAVVFHQGQEIEIQPPTHPVTIVIQDGLPTDEKEAVETELLRRQAGLTSAASAIRRLDGCSEAEAGVELARIREELQPVEPQAEQVQIDKGVTNESRV